MTRSAVGPRRRSAAARPRRGPSSATGPLHRHGSRSCRRRPTSPVAVLTAGTRRRPTASAAATTAAAAPARCPAPPRSPRPTAARSRLSEPKCLSSALRRVSPSPGTSSSAAGRHRLRPALPVVGDREPVRLVADPLQQVEPLAGARQDHRVVVAGQPDLLQPLGQPAHGDVVDARARPAPARRPRPAARRRRPRPGSAGRRTARGRARSPGRCRPRRPIRSPARRSGSPVSARPSTLAAPEPAA